MSPVYSPFTDGKARAQKGQGSAEGHRASQRQRLAGAWCPHSQTNGDGSLQGLRLKDAVRGWALPLQSHLSFGSALALMVPQGIDHPVSCTWLLPGQVPVAQAPPASRH